jgi:hypothetical protein
MMMMMMMTWMKRREMVDQAIGERTLGCTAYPSRSAELQLIAWNDSHSCLMMMRMIVMMNLSAEIVQIGQYPHYELSIEVVHQLETS